MIPAVGTVAKYVFTAPFAALNDVYRLEQATTFAAALALDVDLAKSLYEPAGRTAADYAAEWTAYTAGQVLRLVSVTGAEGAEPVVIYAPEAILAALPDPMVQAYDDLYLAITIGAVRDPSAISWIVGELNQLAAKVTGTGSSAALFSNGAVWLTDAEYAALEAERASRIATYKPLPVTVYELQQQLLAAQTRNAALEAALIALDGATIEGG